MAWMGSLLGAAKQGVRIERALSDPQAVARAVVGVTAAALTGYLLHDPFAASMLSVGAFLTGISSLLARRRHRLTVAVTHAVFLTTAAAVGAVLHPWSWLFLLVLFAGAFVAGWLRVFGAAPSIRACLVLVGLMITADMAPTTAAGLAMAGYVGVGAGMVVIAQLLPPYGPRWAHQRRSIAAVYEALAAAALRATDAPGTVAAPVSLAVLTNARRSLDVLPGPLRPTAAPLFGLLGEAERLVRSIRTLQESSLPDDAGGLELRRARCAAVAEVLRAVATTARTGRRVEPPGGAWVLLSEHEPEHEPKAGPREPSVQEQAASGVDAHLPVLAHRLREAARLAIAATDRRLSERTPPHDELGAHAQPGAVVRNLELLRAELRWQGPMFRHGLRLAVGAVLAEIIGRHIGTWYGLGLQGHAFWITLTTILVLFPEFRHTFSRGVGRSLGTLVGALLGWGLLQLPQGPTSLVVVTIVLAAVALTTLRTGQPMLMVWVTSWVLYLLVQAGLVPAASAWTRAADTVTGAVLAMLLYAVWPTWYTWQLPQELARWLELQGQRFEAILTAASGDPNIDYTALEALRHRSREAREAFETAARNAEEEPVWHYSPWTSEQLVRLHGAVRDLSRHAPLLAEKLLSPASAVPAAARIAGLLREAMSGLARAALGGPPPAPGALRAEWQPYAEQLHDSTSWADRHALPTLQNTVDAVEALATVMAGCAWADSRRRSPHTASRDS